jgi:CspA family cold shock protein
MNGTVTSFDDAVGLGTVTAADGTPYEFHCTQIADGTRTIAVGAAVAFEVGPGGPGRWEARNVQASEA